MIMRIFSRETLVGFLLGVAVATSGCQPVQPVSESANSAVDPVIVESEPVSDTAVLSETQSVEPATRVEITATVGVTATNESTATGMISEAGEIDPALLEAGLLTYRAQYCGVCHTLDAAETRGVFGPPHNDMRAVAEGYFANGQYKGAATTPAEYIRESIVDPQVFISPGFASTSHRMPAYAHLDSATIDALVALLLAQ